MLVVVDGVVEVVFSSCSRSKVRCRNTPKNKKNTYCQRDTIKGYWVMRNKVSINRKDTSSNAAEMRRNAIVGGGREREKKRTLFIEVVGPRVIILELKQQQSSTSAGVW